jgi:putative ABC transport system permease protein
MLMRHRLRTTLTALGVGSGMFLFTAVETMQRSLARATRIGADDTTLVVYRENRFCPATSRLPEHYADQIRRVPGVREVIPVQVVVNNCGASLDVITFRGVPDDQLRRYAPEIEIIEGSEQDWRRRDDGALLGEAFARRRGLKPGDRFDGAGVTVSVAGILRSPNLQDNNVAYVKLPFLQQASRSGLGSVTQFNVRVDSSDRLDAVAAAIDGLFRGDSQPTDTRPEKAFFAETARELISLIGFTRWLGLGAVAAVAGLVANALLLAVRGRVRDTAVMQTLGFGDGAVFWLVTVEGALLGLLGGVPGVLAAAGFFRWRGLTLGSEGHVLALQPDAAVLWGGFALALALGFASSLWPAWQALRQPLTRSLRHS